MLYDEDGARRKERVSQAVLLINDLLEAPTKYSPIVCRLRFLATF